MIQFIKTKNVANAFDISDIVFSIKDNDTALEDILKEFDCFLKACGFNYNGEVTIFDEKEFFKDTETISIELTKTP